MIFENNIQQASNKKGDALEIEEIISIARASGKNAAATTSEIQETVLHELKHIADFADEDFMKKVYKDNKYIRRKNIAGIALSGVSLGLIGYEASDLLPIIGDSLLTKLIVMSGSSYIGSLIFSKWLLSQRNFMRHYRKDAQEIRANEHSASSKGSSPRVIRFKTDK